MATTKTDKLEAKQRKQKIILIVLGVGLLGILALQGPKLIDQLNGSSTPAASSTGDTTATGATTPTTGDTTGTTTTPAPSGSSSAGSVTTTVTPSAGTPSAVLVGVDVPNGANPVPGPGQLKTFSLFEAKDPFVQSLKQETSTGTAAQATASEPDKPAAQNGGGGSVSGTAAGAPAELQFATIAVNGNSQSVEVSKRFPKADKMFVLVSLKPKSAKIAVAGGTFTDGKTLTLQMGDPLTLLNTATGARYNLKLLYTGTSPEQVAGFTQGNG
jgi:hypothetical protein